MKEKTNSSKSLPSLTGNQFRVQSGCWWYKAHIVIPLIWIAPTLSLGHHQHRPQSQTYKRKIFFYKFCSFSRINSISKIQRVGLQPSMNYTSFHLKNIKICKTMLGLWAHKYLQSWVLALYNTIFFCLSTFCAFHSKSWKIPDLFSRLPLISQVWQQQQKKTQLRQQHCDEKNWDNEKKSTLTWFQLYDLHSSELPSFYVSGLKDTTAL